MASDGLFHQCNQIDTNSISKTRRPRPSAEYDFTHSKPKYSQATKSVFVSNPSSQRHKHNKSDNGIPMKQLVFGFIPYFVVLIFALAFPFSVNNSGQTVLAQALIPARFDGFVYENRPVTGDSIIIQAFFDPVCPDSRDAWPPLKRALDCYGDRVSLNLHPFALPYHDNAFVSCRALHVVNKLNSSATYELLELIFKHQDEFYNGPTFNMSRKAVVDRFVSLSTKAVGNSYESDVASGFTDWKTDSLTRISFKYGCTRGVYGTPFFFVNGFSLPNSGSAVGFKEWRNIIDPLIGEQDLDREEPYSSSL